MPKQCSVPHCKAEPGPAAARKSFYKFPLQDRGRLQRWLRNMGRENWTPSRHHYICHEHFAPGCFKTRWGVRYLESEAVPTVFQKTQKSTTADPSEESKDPAGETVLQDGSFAAEAVETLHTVQLYEITVTPSQQAEASMGESSDCFRQTDLNQPATGVNFPLALFQKDLADSANSTEVVVMSECLSSGEPDELVAALLTQGHQLVVDESTLGYIDEASLYVEDLGHTPEHLSNVQEGQVAQEGQEVITYFETIPNILPSNIFTQWNLPPDTVLSSALSSEPITSTLPIVSQRLPPSPESLVLKVDRGDTDGGEGDDGQSEEDSMEWQNRQLEEHCYHKNSLSKEQLEVIVSELQKKVKMLQQRHRRHLDKLVGLENTVSQLRQNNLLNEERLQLLERVAYMQTSAAVSDAGETVAIIYEKDDGAYLYAPLSNPHEYL